MIEEHFLVFSDRMLLLNLHKTYDLKKIIVTKNHVSTVPMVKDLFDEKEILPGHGNDATLLRIITEDIQKKLLPSQHCILCFTKSETVYHLLFNS